MTEDNQDKSKLSQTSESSQHEVLKDLCENNAEYFSKDSSENGQRLYISFLAMKDNVDLIWPLVTEVNEFAKLYDFDEHTPGNGYRSFVKVMDSAVAYGIELNKRVSIKKESVLFRKTIITKEVEACAHLFASLHSCFKHLTTLKACSNNEDLFVSDPHSTEQLLESAMNINQYCFYGRCLGFQFCESMRNILKFIAISMTIFSEAYYSEGSLFSKATNSVFTTTKYVIDPEERAKRIVNISQNADVNFCKSFWFLSETELMHHLPSVVADNVAVSKIISLPPEPFTLTVDGEEVEVPVPNSHIGRKPLQVRLISHEIREGMIGEGLNPSKVKPASRGLMVHCHGGGFVAQSSRSHECYLRQWAKELQVPILSIDYSLAPDAAFPRALEEVTYAYCWALKNHQLLGSTGERVVMAGDSAGGNLLLATCIKCVDLKLPKPHGIFVAYTPTLINFFPSPGRLLCIMDPLLPFGFLMRCLKAYVSNYSKDPENNGNNKSDTESFEEITESDLLELQAHKSPTSETSDTTLTYGSLNSQAEDGRGGTGLTPADEHAVSDLLEKYVLDSDTDTDGTRVPMLIREDRSTASVDAENSLQTKVASFILSVRGRLENLVPSQSPSGAVRALDAERERNMLDEFKFTVPQNPYLSPYCASDEVLRQFPPVKILTVHMDPCLDDCVMFAKRLRNVGNEVTLEILDGLPHGFLNLSLVSKEALEACKTCINRISQLLDLDSLPQSQES